jgi:hypothetical protein
LSDQKSWLDKGCGLLLLKQRIGKSDIKKAVVQTIAGEEINAALIRIADSEQRGSMG